MKRPPLDATAQERDVLARILAAPPAELRGLLNRLDAVDLHTAQWLVGALAERKVERDVEIRREVASVVAWRYPNGWPSPGSSIEPQSIPSPPR